MWHHPEINSNQHLGSYAIKEMDFKNNAKHLNEPSFQHTVRARLFPGGFEKVVPDTDSNESPHRRFVAPLALTYA